MGRARGTGAVTVVLMMLGGFALAGCAARPSAPRAEPPAAAPSRVTHTPSASAPPSPDAAASLQARSRGRVDVYAADRPGMLSPVVKGFRSLVYVPNSESGTVDVIDPQTYRIVRHFTVGALPQHVVPSWDLKTLWVNNNRGNSLTPIDPRTGRPGRPVPVEDPYNLYFSPDGTYALVMAERNNQLDLRDPHSMKLLRSLSLPCRGINHGDFTADGSVFLASCEFSGGLVVLDWRTPSVIRHIHLGHMSMPQDVKLSPDGTVFYVADMERHGVWLVDAATYKVMRFLPTGRGAHGLYVSRDSRRLYVSNRGEGSVSVVSFRKRKVVDVWRIPGGGSPDMGGVSADGTKLWLSGRYHGVVYVFDTRDGRVVRTIPVGAGPHGLCVYPQPGRYSLGHTGIFR
ncbi:YncE family protein [Microbispora rosea]